MFHWYQRWQQRRRADKALVQAVAILKANDEAIRRTTRELAELYAEIVSKTGKD